MTPTIYKKKPPSISVWLNDDCDNPEVLKRFHCVECGKVVFEYYNAVKMVVFGKHFEKRPKVVLCNGTIIIDKETGQAISPKNKDPFADYDRYVETRCKARYWVS